jgi:hypothetical protein
MIEAGCGGGEQFSDTKGARGLPALVWDPVAGLRGFDGWSRQ